MKACFSVDWTSGRYCNTPKLRRLPMYHIHYGWALEDIRKPCATGGEKTYQGVWAQQPCVQRTLSSLCLWQWGTVPVTYNRPGMNDLYRCTDRFLILDSYTSSTPNVDFSNIEARCIAAMLAGGRVHRELEKQLRVALNYGRPTKFMLFEFKTAPNSPDLIVIDEAEKLQASTEVEGHIYEAIRTMIAKDPATIGFRRRPVVCSVDWAARAKAREAYKRPSQDAAAERMGHSFRAATEDALKRAGMKFTRVMDEYIIEPDNEAEQKMWRGVMARTPPWMSGNRGSAYAKERLEYRGTVTGRTSISEPQPQNVKPPETYRIHYRGKVLEFAESDMFAAAKRIEAFKAVTDVEILWAGSPAPQPMWVDHKTRSYEPPNHGPALQPGKYKAETVDVRMEKDRLVHTVQLYVKDGLTQTVEQARAAAAVAEAKKITVKVEAF